MAVRAGSGQKAGCGGGPVGRGAVGRSAWSSSRPASTGRSPTTVLWLTDVYGLDIRCGKITPYKVAERLLLDVQQIIPLPEASGSTVQIRRKQTQARAVHSDGRDWTQYEVITPDGRSGPLRKRSAVLTMATALHRAGLTAHQLTTAIPPSRFLPVDGILSGEELATALLTAYLGATKRLGRRFLDAPLHDLGRTRVVSRFGEPAPSLCSTGSSPWRRVTSATSRRTPMTSEL
jgi:hypothetical protein